MRTICLILLWAFSCALPSPAQKLASDPVKLLDRLAGNWILQGTIAGKQTTHDVHAAWILRREYLQLHEVSREKNASGDPAYEAVILISWDPKANQYSCLWLDSTEGGALSSHVTCRAIPAADAIPFVFTISATDSIHTTFSYRGETDTWQWVIDNLADGKTSRFATLSLSRAK
jgi:hypothetical protein